MTSKNTAQTPDAEGPVLVAVDFTADSEAALVWAGAFADKAGGKIIVLHVVHDPAEAPGSYRKHKEDLLQPMEEVAKTMMTELMQKVVTENPGIVSLKNAETVTVKGIPAPRILEEAEALGARGIVMGSRGRTGLPHLLLGSKAERVVQLSKIPVTIIKASDDE